MAKQSYFETLNQALEAEGLVELWPTGTNINYGQTVEVTVDNGTKYGKLISVYRSDSGRYERPVHYNR